MTASVRITTKITAQTVKLPDVGGYGGTVLIPADTGHPGTILTLSVSTAAPASTQGRIHSATAARHLLTTSIASPPLYLTLTADTASQLSSQPGFNIELPSNTQTAGTAFYLSVFDPANSSSNYLIGPGTLQEGSLDFQTGSSALTFFSGETVAFTLFAVAGNSPTSGPSGSPDIQDYTLQSVTQVLDITEGPDKNIWFVGNSPSTPSPVAVTLGSITTSGMVTEFPPFVAPPTLAGSAGFVHSGPDGRLWYTAGTNGVAAAGRRRAEIRSYATSVDGSVPVAGMTVVNGEFYGRTLDVGGAALFMGRSSGYRSRYYRAALENAIGVAHAQDQSKAYRFTL